MDINWQEYFQLKETRQKFEKSTKRSFLNSRLAGTNAYLGIEADEQTKALFSNNLRNKKDLEFLFNEFKKQGLIPEFIHKLIILINIMEKYPKYQFIITEKNQMVYLMVVMLLYKIQKFYLKI